MAYISSLGDRSSCKLQRLFGTLLLLRMHLLGIYALREAGRNYISVVFQCLALVNTRMLTSPAEVNYNICRKLFACLFSFAILTWVNAIVSLNVQHNAANHTL